VHRQLTQVGKVENPDVNLDGIIHMGVDFLNP